jgi:hypothetical protein
VFISLFYIGEPPNCQKARKHNLIHEFGKKFDMEKEKRKKRLCKMKRKKISKNSGRHLKRRHPLETSDSTQPISLGRGEVTSLDYHQRPIPGNLYWRRLGTAISSRCAKWERYHQKHRQVRERVATWPIMVICTPCYLRMKLAVAPRYLKVKRFFCTDPETGRDVFQKIADHLQVTMFGHTSSWPMLILLGMVVIAIVVLGFYSILKRILLAFI